MKTQKELNENARKLAQAIVDAGARSHNEAELKTSVSLALVDVARRLDLTLDRREEYTLINGRVDALYSRLVIEYEPPHSLKSDNDYRTNAHAIEQIKAYIQGLAQEGRQKQERYAGVVLDGARYIFIRVREGTWHIEAASTVTDRSTERFLKFSFFIKH